MARALSRTQVPRAAGAVAEAAGIVGQLAPEGGGAFRAFAEQIARTRRQVHELMRRLQAGEPLGIPGMALPDGMNWREQFWQVTLENLDVSALLDELKNADQVEALLRGMGRARGCGGCAQARPAVRCPRRS